MERFIRMFRGEKPISLAHEIKNPRVVINASVINMLKGVVKDIHVGHQYPPNIKTQAEELRQLLHHLKDGEILNAEHTKKLKELLESLGLDKQKIAELLSS